MGQGRASARKPSPLCQPRPAPCLQGAGYRGQGAGDCPGDRATPGHGSRPCVGKTTICAPRPAPCPLSVGAQVTALATARVLASGEGGASRRQPSAPRALPPERQGADDCPADRATPGHRSRPCVGKTTICAPPPAPCPLRKPQNFNPSEKRYVLGSWYAAADVGVPKLGTD